MEPPNHAYVASMWFRIIIEATTSIPFATVIMINVGNKWL